jgi:RNA polymerase primary sigma factor
MKDVGHYPLLGPQEERELAVRYKDGRAAQRRLQGQEGLPWPERRRLQATIAAGDSARRRLIESNLRLVIKLIGQYAYCGLSFDDMVQEGNIGLIKAVERYDHKRGVRFSTYAGWWIKQSVLRAAANHSRTIRRPPWVVQKMGQLRRARSDLENRLGRAPADAELARALDWSVHRVREIARYALPEVSLDMTVSEEEDCQLRDLLPDRDAVAPDEEVLRRQACERLRAALESHLRPRAQAVLCLRYGLDGGPHRTLGAVGDELGITSERVRQIEKSALRRLRRAMAREEG